MGAGYEIITPEEVKENDSKAVERFFRILKIEAPYKRLLRELETEKKALKVAADPHGTIIHHSPGIQSDHHEGKELILTTVAIPGTLHHVGLLDKYKVPIIRVKSHLQASAKHRFKFTRAYDLFESMTVLCQSPLEIKSVTLFMHQSLPKNPLIARKILNKESLTKEEAMWIYQQEDCFTRYIPVIKLKGPFTSRTFRFTELPIPLLGLIYEALSVEIEYNDPPGFVARSPPVIELTQYMLQDPYREFPYKELDVGPEASFPPGTP